MPQRATIESITQAFRMLKQMRAQELEWGRPTAELELKRVLEQRMAARVDRHLEEMGERGTADRLNSSNERWLMTELGEIELRVPCTRRYSAQEGVRAYADAPAGTLLRHWRRSRWKTFGLSSLTIATARGLVSVLVRVYQEGVPRR